MFKNLSAEMKAGLIPVVPYVIFIIFLLALMPFKDGLWMLIPLGIITYFPFIFLFELFLAWIAGWQDVPLGDFSGYIAKMIIGGFINTVVLFLCPYLLTVIYKKIKNSPGKRFN